MQPVCNSGVNASLRNFVLFQWKAFYIHLSLMSILIDADKPALESSEINNLCDQNFIVKVTDQFHLLFEVCLVIDLNLENDLFIEVKHMWQKLFSPYCIYMHYTITLKICQMLTAQVQLQ